MAELSLDLNEELALMTSTEQAAVIVLLLGEQQAADIIQYLNPREVQSLGSAMVGVVDLSQDSVNLVLDNFAGTGTTAHACILTDRKYIVMERDEKYFEIIKSRMVNEFSLACGILNDVKSPAVLFGTSRTFNDRIDIPD